MTLVRGRRELLLGGLGALGAVGLGCAGAAPGGAPPPGPTTRAAAPAPRAPARAPLAPLFDAHVGAWLSLHHVLHELGSKRKEPEAWRAPGIDAMAGLDLGPGEAAAWSTSVEAYAAATGGRDPVRDGELARINGVLAARESSVTLAPAALPAELSRALEGAMPTYRGRWWSRHEAACRSLLTAVDPLVQEHGAALAEGLARAYQTPWLQAPPRLDVVPYANWAGAYSTLSPTHLVMASIDDRHTGTQTLEILFHEASHAMIAKLRADVGREVDARGKDEKSLWHALLFFTTGELVRRRSPDHVPYAAKNGLYERRWADYRAAMEAHWVPWLDGRAPYEAALRDLVAAL